METILAEVEKALDAGFYYLAVALAITLPDICSAVEARSGKTSKAQYKAWYEAWMAVEYPEITGDDLYSLRCGVIHEGRFGHVNMQYQRIIFTIPARNTFHRNIVFDALNLDAKIFCCDAIAAVHRWHASKQNDPVVRNNLPKVLQFRANGLAPYFIGVPVIT